ncbi:homoserine dehydrogenase [Niallia nealsonii]|uniref:Homoserine dehydrogenase n=1 Tax=Niallia nealsonii TaxID=115979 RepID=A0A2N0Z5L7_9BACI|nr:homoserine dehydrogenase [Niallia nealsonii]
MITGYGNVSRELMKLILEKEAFLNDQYGLEWRITSIVGSRGMVYEKGGIDLLSLLEFGTGSNALEEYCEMKNLELLPFSINDQDVLIESTPTDIFTGGSGLAYSKSAIENGLDVVFVSKGALVNSQKEINALAASHHVSLKFSGATAAALPTIDIVQNSLNGTVIKSIEGILNGTTNFILSKMHHESISFETALEIAISQGIAEKNSTLDIGGFDAAAKAIILANNIYDQELTIKDAEITGIDDVAIKDILHAKERDKKIKLIAKITKDKDGAKVKVAPMELSSDHLLYYVDETNKGIIFHTEEMGSICAAGGASNIRATAAAVLKDLINLYKGD